jgi:8-oxo-dGTP pyrophosphatase MutT (NUDIX family)
MSATQISGRAVQRFEVSLKAFIVQGGKALLVQEADTGYWELPGGRIDVGEEWSDHGAILQREIAEELGDSLALTIGTDAVTWVRQRPTDGVFQFLVARVCPLVRGAPRLSAEHASLAWHTPETWATLTFPERSGYGPALMRLWAIATRPG